MKLNDIDIIDESYELSEGYSESEGGGSSGGVDPEVIAGAVGSVADLAGSFAQNRNEDKQNIKLKCGRKPLFNIGGKKDAYFACVDDYFKMQQPQDSRASMYQQMPPPPQKKGLSTGAVVGIVLGVVALGFGIYYVATKNKTVAKAK